MLTTTSKTSLSRLSLLEGKRPAQKNYPNSIIRLIKVGPADRQQAGGNNLNTWIILLLTILLTVFGGIFDTGTPDQTTETIKSLAQGDVAEITVQSAGLRSSPKGKLLTTLSRGTHVLIVCQKDGWYKVNTLSGTTGWIAGWMLARSKQQHLGNGNTAVVGYYVDDASGSSFNSLLINHPSIAAVVPFAYRIDEDGNLHGHSPERALSLAGAHGIKTLVLIHNLNQGAFDGDVIHRVLSSKTYQEQLIKAIRDIIRKWGYSGVNIDFENVPPEDRHHLSEFMAKLYATLHEENLLVTMSVPAKTHDSPGNKWNGAYDYAALARTTDYMLVMTYDQHYRTGPPGPIAGADWVRDVVTYSLKHIPGNRLILGVAAYGYDWARLGPTYWSGRALSASRAQALAAEKKAQIKWDKEACCPYFLYYQDGIKHEVWFENSYSLSHKLQIVSEFNLAGIAIWRLGYEDPRTWSVIRTTLF